LLKDRSEPSQPKAASSAVAYRVPDLNSLARTVPRGRIAIVLHLYYPELWPELRDSLKAMPEPSDLFVTLTAGCSDEAADWVRADYPTAHIITLENHGRDIFPFVVLINSGVLDRYGLVCKLHTKRSMRRIDGDGWRHDLLSGVLSDPDYVSRILRAFDTDPDLGIVVAAGSVRRDAKNWRPHLCRVNELCARIGLPAVPGERGYPEFPAGSIYWIRSSLLRPLAELMLTAADFEPEPLPRGGGTIHAVERLVGHVCREAGMYVEESSAFMMQR
jgi:lipopolysaccharide biosynthesis protein